MNRDEAKGAIVFVAVLVGVPAALHIAHEAYTEHRYARGLALADAADRERWAREIAERREREEFLRMSADLKRLERAKFEIQVEVACAHVIENGVVTGVLGAQDDVACRSALEAAPDDLGESCATKTSPACELAGFGRNGPQPDAPLSRPESGDYY